MPKSKDTPAKKTTAKKVVKKVTKKAIAAATKNVTTVKVPAKTAKSKPVDIATLAKEIDADALRNTLLNTLRQQLKQAGLFGMGRPPRVVVAYSGGNDSTALLHLVGQLRDADGVDVIAVYHHHNWRGTPAPELPRVHKNCQRFRVPLVFSPPHPDEEKNEHSARHYRYERLIAIAQQYKAEAILTAHHQDDQVETLMFRLFRGTGIDGLEGIQRHLVFNKPGSPLQSTLPVIRPLLDVSQQQLAIYNHHNELNAFEDPSNTNTKYARNAIRHDILPLIHERFPHYKKALLRLSHLAKGDLEILDNITPRQWNDLELKGAKPSVFQVDEKRSTTRFSQLNLPYQRRLIRHLLEQFNIESSLEDTERAIHFLDQKGVKVTRYAGKDAVKKMSLGDTMTGDKRFLLRSPEAFWIEIHPKRDDAYALAISKILEVPMGGGLISVPWDAGQSLRVEPSPKRAGMFDVRKLPDPKAKALLVNASSYEGKALVIRSRKIGDWLKPLGMKGKHMKLKDFFIARRVPVELRDEWPLIACEDEILWVPGIGVSESLRVTTKNPPSHTWMLGATEELEQLRTLRFLDEDEEMPPEDASDDEELIDIDASQMDIDIPDIDD